MQKITIIGTGYVGLVSGTCFAELGNQVTCLDIDKQKIRQLQAGQVPIYETGLEELFRRNTAQGRLHFTDNLEEAMKGAEIVFLALPTPPANDGSADLSIVLSVASQLGPLLEDYTVIVDKSTVPVGTAERVREIIGESAKVEFDVVSNPEFLREGIAIQDCMQPDRIVIGSSSPRARAVMDRLYEPLVQNGSPLLHMSERSAELTKYAGNAFLATKITFMNQIANLCELTGADIDDVRLGVGTDSRIGQAFLYPGIGYGGSCFPKDVLALQHMAKERAYDFHMLQDVIDANIAQQSVLTQKVLRYFKGDVSGKAFALWGLAFKPETDDMREAPALRIVQALTTAGATIRAYDPEAMKQAKTIVGSNSQVVLCKDAYDTLEGADALLIATEWHEFAAVSVPKVKELLKEPTIFDGRNIFRLADMQKAGFYYESIGRPRVTPK